MEWRVHADVPTIEPASFGVSELLWQGAAPTFVLPAVAWNQNGSKIRSQYTAYDIFHVNACLWRPIWLVVQNFLAIVIYPKTDPTRIQLLSERMIQAFFSVDLVGLSLGMCFFFFGWSWSHTWMDGWILRSLRFLLPNSFYLWMIM